MSSKKRDPLSWLSSVGRALWKPPSLTPADISLPTPTREGSQEMCAFSGTHCYSTSCQDSVAQEGGKMAVERPLSMFATGPEAPSLLRA